MSGGCGCNGRLGGGPNAFKVGIVNKGGAGVVASNLPLISGAATFQLNGTGTASVTVETQNCRPTIETLDTWCQEMVVSWRGAPLWVGPVVSIDAGRQTTTIDAVDLSGWFDRRRIRTDQRHANADLADIWQDYATAAGVADLGITYTGSRANILSTRAVTEDEYQYLGKALGDLSGSGLDWSITGRDMHFGESLRSFGGLRFSDSSFLTAPNVLTDGTTQANVVTVLSSSEGGRIEGCAEDLADQARCGILEFIYTDDSIRNRETANDTAAQILATLQNNTYINLESEQQLSPYAGLCAHQLIPGALADVSLAQSGRRVTQRLQINSARFTADGSASVSLSPARTLETVGIG